MNSTKKINARKTWLILFIASMTINLLYYVVDKYFHLVFRNQGVIFFSFLITLISILYYLPRLSIVLRIISAVILAALIFIDLILIRELIIHPDEVTTFTSPNNKNTIVVEMSTDGSFEHQYFLLKNRFFMKELHGVGNIHNFRYPYYIVKWVDNDTVEVSYYDPGDDASGYVETVNLNQ
jgi:hypothetical protein